jgi:hypothetical protein
MLSLHELSERMTNPRSGIEIPPSAAERIVPTTAFSALVKQQWNEQIDNLFKRATDWQSRRG